MSAYTIRWYRPADRAQFLDLYADVLATWRHSPDWFDWKYVSNPYLDHVPIVVATADGDLVGARAFFALSMSVDGDRFTAVQPCDTMVQESHRRRGLFTRMTELALDRYADHEAAFCFNYPNERTLGGNLQLGWERAGTAPLAYRVEHATPLLATHTTVPGYRLAGAVGTRLVGGYNRLRERLAGSPAAVSVRHETPVPADDLAAIYEASVPETIHAVRDQPFYRWRLSNPNLRYSAFLAGTGDERTAAVVARRPPGKLYGPEITSVVDVVPVAGRDQPPSLVRALLERVRATFPTSDLFVAPTTVPDAVLREQAFHRADEPPLSMLSDRPRLVRALDSWAPAETPLTDAENWTTTLLETDTW